jgi:hypothetical protein
MNIISNKVARIIFSIIILLNIIIIFVKPLGVDVGVYWMYGNHFRWVYLDAPPLVGVLIRFITTLLGVNVWSINLLSFILVFSTAYLVYRFAKELYNTNTAIITTISWLTAPAVLHFYFRYELSYHNVLSFFWLGTIYFFYKAADKKRNMDIYLAALFVYLSILSQVDSGLLVIGLLISVSTLKKYREILFNRHAWIALSILLAALSPYLYGLFQSGFLPLKTLFSLHVNETNELVNFSHFFGYVNVALNELNFYLILIVLVLMKCFKEIKKNTDQIFLLILSASTFFPFLVLSFHSSVLVQFYLPFYYTALLALMPYMMKISPKFLKFSIYFNLILLIIDSWNVIYPQYGLGQGSGAFHGQLNQRMAVKYLRPLIKKEDLLLDCASEPINDYSMGEYINLSTMAFHLNHKKTYALNKGYYLWQAPLESILASSSGKKLLYICLKPKILVNKSVVCGDLKKVSVYGNHFSTSYSNILYYQRCNIK